MSEIHEGDTRTKGVPRGFSVGMRWIGLNRVVGRVEGGCAGEQEVIRFEHLQIDEYQT